MAKKKATKKTTRTTAPKAPAKTRRAKKGSKKALSGEDQLLAQISKDIEKMLENFIQKQYAALSDFASDIVVSTAKRLLEDHKH
jgi:hypothetical protein